MVTQKGRYHYQLHTSSDIYRICQHNINIKIVSININRQEKGVILLLCGTQRMCSNILLSLTLKSHTYTAPTHVHIQTHKCFYIRTLQGVQWTNSDSSSSTPTQSNTLKERLWGPPLYHYACVVVKQYKSIWFCKFSNSC